MQIHKFQAYLDGAFEIKVPVDAKVLYCHDQNGHMVFWMGIDDELEKVKRTFIIVGTGHDYDTRTVEYCGSFMMTPFVWHLMEIQ